MSTVPDQQVTPEGAPPVATIDTLPPRAITPAGLTPLNARTGEPVRPWTIWVGPPLLLAAAIATLVGLGQVMWNMASPFVREGEGYLKNDRFQVASWLSGQWVTEPGSGARVALAVAVTLIAVLIAAVCSVVAFYAFRGFRWTRIGSVVACVTSLAALTLNQLAWIAIPLAVLGALPLWLPTTARYFARWHGLRHPEVVYADPVDAVFYGPMPRYR